MAEREKRIREKESETIEIFRPVQGFRARARRPEKSDDPLSEFDANKMTLLTRESSMRRKEGMQEREGRR